MKLEAEGWEQGRGSWKEASKLEGLGERCKRTKSPENVSSGRKCRLVPISGFDSAELFDASGRTIRFHGTAVEKHCIRDILDVL